MKVFYFAFTRVLGLSMLFGCVQTKTKAQTPIIQGHSHYSDFLEVPAHKVIFPSAVPDRIIMNLTEDPAHQVAINWRTDQTVAQGYVEIAKETHGPDFLLEGNRRRLKAKTQLIENQNTMDGEPPVKAAYHAVLVDGLMPGNTYVYRVGDGSETEDTRWSEWFQFKTPMPENGRPFSFIYFGDAQNNVKSMWSRVVRKSYQMMPSVDFMLHAGDLINHSDSNIEWGEWFFAGGHIHATVPSIMTPGNHEYKRGVLSPLWRPQFNLPTNGPSEDTRETCYAIDYKNMKLISIDAVRLIEDDASRRAQVKWLDSVLAQNSKKWTVMTMHYPIFSTAKGRDNTVLRESLLPLINKYQVDLVLQGHDHTYARGTVTNQDEGLTVQEDAGTVYAVSVSGPKMYASQDQEWMQRRGEYTQLFQLITVHQDSLSYEAFTPMGSVYDAFDLVKDQNGQKRLTNRVPDIPERFRSDFIKKD